MAPLRFDVNANLRRAFLKAELEFLLSEAGFNRACAQVTNLDEFQKLCALGDELLRLNGKAAQVGQQFRQQPRPDGSSRPASSE